MVYLSGKTPSQPLRDLHASTFSWPEDMGNLDGKTAQAEPGRRPRSPAESLSGPSSPVRPSSESFAYTESPTEPWSLPSGSLHETSGPEEDAVARRSSEESTTAPRPAAQSPTLEFFWPNIKSYLQQGAEGEAIQCACNVCLDELDIAGMPGPHGDEAPGGNCRLTPCGHTFCQRCIRRIADMGSCPVCRVELRCRGCGQMPSVCSPYAKRRGDGPGVAVLPASMASILTIPEGGEFVRECARCMARKNVAAQAEEEDSASSSSSSSSEEEDTLAPEFARFLSFILDQMEDQHKPCHRTQVVAAFAVMMGGDEFDRVSEDREQRIRDEMQRLRDEGANPWFYEP